MKSKYVEYLLFIGIFHVFLNYGFAQQDMKQMLCDGVQENTYIRNVSDCTMWIKCKNPPSSGFCPDTYYFGQELQACTSRERAKCFVCPDTASLSFEVVESSCNRYIRCVKGVPSEHFCDSGLQFNRNTRKCDFPSTQSCSPGNDIPTDIPTTSTTEIPTTSTTEIPTTSTTQIPTTSTTEIQITSTTEIPTTSSIATPSTPTPSTVTPTTVTSTTVTPSSAPF